ncbi:uncharacterized protein [Choristoneura fumiferana]|uniref:uncharacterized protein n=1 Tax=Choristoneura fumiferana TaxID=7141 RepID=UPI003D157380
MAEQIFNLKLVAEIGKHPCLYNYNLPQYSRKDITEKAWHDIGKAVNLSGNECKERWKNLRAVFVRHLKPGSGNKTNKPYYLAESMQFALPFIKTLHKGASAAQRAAKAQLDTDSDHDDGLLTPTLVTTERPSPSTSPSSQPAFPSPQPCNYWRNTSRRAEEEQDALADDRTNGDAKDPREDANRMFLLSLLPDMNQMTPSQVRRFKRKALESIDDILEGVVIKQEPE